MRLLPEPLSCLPQCADKKARVVIVGSALEIFSFVEVTLLGGDIDGTERPGVFPRQVQVQMKYVYLLKEALSLTNSKLSAIVTG